MPPYVSGAKVTNSTVLDKLVDMQDFLDYIKDDNMDVALLKRLGILGKEDGEGGRNRARATKTEWSQTALRPRGETITTASGATSVTVSDARIYQVGELLRVDNEVYRVTGITNATTIAVTSGWAGTTTAAHTAKFMYSLGKAAEENSVPGASITDTPTKLFNYVQTFDVPVEVSKDQIMSWTVDGNTIDSQLERRFIEVNRQYARAMLYGIKFEDTSTLSTPIRSMGGLISFLSSNVTVVGGALTIAAIDAQILKIVNAGAAPKTIALSPYQKQKLDALDTNKQLLGKKEHIGGNLITNTWQSGILDHPLDIVVDKNILDTQLLILDDDQIEPLPFEGNGESGTWATYNATAPGQDGTKKVIRGKYTLKVHNEKSHGLLDQLT